MNIYTFHAKITCLKQVFDSILLTSIHEDKANHTVNPSLMLPAPMSTYVRTSNPCTYPTSINESMVFFSPSMHGFLNLIFKKEWSREMVK